MKKILLMSIVLAFFSCEAQNAHKNKKTNQPKITSKVNKQYDKNGNLISRDSTYTYSYSSSGGNIEQMDSLINGFQPFINSNFGEIFNDNFKDFFNGNNLKNDSLMMKDFFEDDFFEHQNKIMRQMMQQMDSLKNEYFKSIAPVPKNKAKQTNTTSI